MGLLKDGGWDESTKRAVWNACRICPGYDAATWRYDRYGTPMKWEQYGNRSSEHGWEIDHIHPQSKGGGDQRSNLQALNWKNNASKSDGQR